MARCNHCKKYYEGPPAAEDFECKHCIKQQRDELQRQRDEASSRLVDYMEVYGELLAAAREARNWLRDVVIDALSDDFIEATEARIGMLDNAIAKAEGK